MHKLGIAEQTFYRWKRQYGGLEPSQVRELPQLQEVNAKLKKRVTDLSLEKAMVKYIAQKSGEVSAEAPLVLEKAVTRC